VLTRALGAEELARLFAMADLDSSGAIDAAELEAALSEARGRGGEGPRIVRRSDRV
jgi:hypothetical protein